MYLPFKKKSNFFHKQHIRICKGSCDTVMTGVLKLKNQFCHHKY